MRAPAFFGLLALAGLVAWGSSGWLAVAPGEAAVVRRLGRVLPEPWGPGPHLGWPAGIDLAVRVRTDEVRRLHLGPAGEPGAADPPGSGEYLTGDGNLVRARAAVQYRVAEPVAYVLRSASVAPILGRLGEASLARALARRGIDAALRDERAALAREVEAELNAASREHGLGVAVLGVSLTELRPPTEVQADFAAAQSAASERDRRIAEARSYADAILPPARGAASAKLDAAHAAADRTEALARAAAGRFLDLLAEAERSRSLTFRRIYLDALAEMLPKVRRKLVLSPDEPVDLSILDARD